VKKITTGRTVFFQHKLLLVNAMVDQHIGSKKLTTGSAIHFNTVLLATFDERDCIITG
jgi:hypothetical protein